MKARAPQRVVLGASAMPKLALLAAIGLSAPTWAPHAHGAAAVKPNYENVNTARWRCRLCPFDTHAAVEGAWRVGGIAVKDSEPRFGRDTGLIEAGAYPAIGADYRYSDDRGRQAIFDATDLGLDARQAEFRARQFGRYDLVLRWREIPHHVAVDGRTPYRGRTALSLPADWVAAFNTGGMTRLEAASRPFDRATHRERKSGHLRLQPARGVRLGAAYSRETVRGTEETYGDIFYQAAGLPKPVDHRTDDLSGHAVFARQSFLLSAELRQSTFRNAYRSLTWQSAYLGRPDTFARRALAPDNDARSLSVVSRASIGRTRINTSLSWARMRQNEAFLPYTTNGDLALAPPSASGLDGRVQTFVGTLSAVSHLTDRLRLGFTRRQQNREHATPPFTLTPVLGDLFATAGRSNRNYGLSVEKTAIRLRYRLAPTVAVTAGARINHAERAPLEIDENRERSHWIELSARGLNGLRVALKATDSTRAASPFVSTTRNNPLTRRFYQAPREQRTWRADVDYQFAATAVSLGFDADYHANDYLESALGVLRDNDRGWGVEFGYAPNKQVALTAFLADRDNGSTTVGSFAFKTADWRYVTRDAARTSGATLALNSFPIDGLSITLTYSRSAARGRYETQTASLGPVGTSTEEAPFPTLVSNYRAFDLEARYRLRKRTSLLLRYYVEDYRATDWALDGVGQDSIASVIAFGRGAPAYSNSLVSIAIERRR